MKRIFVPGRSERTFEDVSSQIKKLILEGVPQPDSTASDREI
jgi:hypothetical protein